MRDFAEIFQKNKQIEGAGAEMGGKNGFQLHFQNYVSTLNCKILRLGEIFCLNRAACCI